VNQSQARLIKHLGAHEAVIGNEYWYGDGQPLMHPSLSAKKTAKRRSDVVDILLKAGMKNEASGDRIKAKLLKRLANKIDHCRRGFRCGSLACPECARAFQRPAAQRQLFQSPASKPANTNSDGANNVLVMVTVIPLHLVYTPTTLTKLDIAKRTRWLKDVLTKVGLTQMLVGSADISWETPAGQGLLPAPLAPCDLDQGPGRTAKATAKSLSSKEQIRQARRGHGVTELEFFSLHEQGNQAPRSFTAKPATLAMASLDAGLHGSA
jgi:hypothetical protein